MTPGMLHIHAIGADEAPGLSATLRLHFEGGLEHSPAGGFWKGEHSELQPGDSAWCDPIYSGELRRMHVQLGASGKSLESLDSLADGSASCVITGQQPALLGGPLYTCYKIAGTIALADTLRRQSGRPVVPVYWCGSDDSDFAEIRRTWFWEESMAVFRGEIPETLWKEGQRIGSIAGSPLAELEMGILEHAFASSSAGDLREWIGGFDPRWDLAGRMAAFYLQRFAAEGLVVVDARSQRLRQLGLPLLRDYARHHQLIAAELKERGRIMQQSGLGIPLADSALESGLFVVDADIRHKLPATELDGDLCEVKEYAPSVLMRPLWQDALLKPEISVLGPSELAYHIQIAPLYERFSVKAPRIAPRPHLMLLPPDLPVGETGSKRRDLLQGADVARKLLAAAAMPASWNQATERFEEAMQEAASRLVKEIDSKPAEEMIKRWSERMRRQWHQQVESLEQTALNSDALERQSWSWAPEWIAPRGIVQERAFASALGWWWLGHDFDRLLQEMQKEYVDALKAGRAVCYVAAGDSHV